MREILFRGKRIDNGEWAYGYFCEFANNRTGEQETYIQTVKKDGRIDLLHKVDPTTVGQFTGLTDKNGKRIFEGDVIKCDNGCNPPVTAVVKFGENFPKMFYDMLDIFYSVIKRLPAISFYAESIDKHQHLILFQSPFVEVIGNIHDNPELLEGERKDNG